MSRARDMANLGSQAGSGFDASDLTTGTLGNTVQDNITRLGTVTTGTLSHGTTLQKWVDSSNTGVTFPDGHVIQYQSKNVTGYYGTSLGSFQHMSGYDLNITPQYNDSKIILNWSGNWYMNNDNRHGYFTIARGSTFLGHYITATNGGEGLRLYMSANTGAHWQTVNVYHIDEPNTTSEITYKVYIRSSNTDTTFRINYSTQYFSNFSISEIKV